MTTKDKLLLDADDDFTQRLFELSQRREKLEAARELYGADQASQLDIDRALRALDDRRKKLLHLKAQTARL